MQNQTNTSNSFPMEEAQRQEAVYLVDGKIYLHLKETVTRTGLGYESFDKATGAAIDTGLISDEEMLSQPVRNPIACARVMAIQEIGLKGEVVSKVALRTLDQLKDARRAFRKAHRNDPHDHSIRFITSGYDELFRIPNGGKVKVDYPDRCFIAPCEYVDDYHTRIGGELFHICQFAELMERGDGNVSPEPEMLQDQAAWQIGHKEYLSIQSTGDGWDYTVYDRDFDEVDSGQIELPDITIQECRDMILADWGWKNRNFCEADRDMVEEHAANAAEEHRKCLQAQLRSKTAVKGD